MKKIGQIIYSYRKIHKLSQEALADIVGVSSAAVSKWERDISFPDITVLCKLADYFEISMDRLLGRDSNKLVDIQFANQQDADRYYVAMQLLECCTIAREKGLLAVEQFVKNNSQTCHSFLVFSVQYLLKELQDNTSVQDIKPFLFRYAECESDQHLARMITESLTLIFSGECEEYLKEVLRSFLGRKYAHLIPYEEQSVRLMMNREELIAFYANYKCGITDTTLLDEIVQYNDLTIQFILRCLENQEISYLLAGASTEVRTIILNNLSERMIYFVGEGMINKKISEEDVIYSQKRVLDLKNVLL